MNVLNNDSLIQNIEIGINWKNLDIKINRLYINILYSKVKQRLL